MTTHDAPPTLGDTFARQLRHFRTRRGLSQRALAEACSAAGYKKLTEPSIVNLESRATRRRLTVEDWLALADVLEVPPLSLILPLGWASDTAIGGNEPIDVGVAISWLRSEVDAPFDRPPGSKVPVSGAHPGWIPRPMDPLALRTLDLAASHAALVRSAERNVAYGGGQLALRGAVDELLRVRQEMAGRDETLPPLSATMAALLENPPEVFTYGIERCS